MLSLPQRLAARISKDDAWDSGGGFVLDYQAGAHISSYTGPRGWNSGAGHDPPSSKNVLLAVREEIVQVYASLSIPQRRSISEQFMAADTAFVQQPNMSALIRLASVIDRIHTLFATLEEDIDFDAPNNIVERRFDS